MTSLRPYQEGVLTELTDLLRSTAAAKALVVAPTGSGKTIIGAELIRQAAGAKVLFLAHRRELIRQAQSKLAEAGIKPGIMLADVDPDEMADVQVASVQTLWRRRATLPPADLVIVDEAHRSRARTYQSLLARYPRAAVVGLTATPCRTDGRGLGNIFDTMVSCPQVAELIDQGHLVRTKVYAPSTPDLHGVHVRMGDYKEDELAAAVDTPKLVGDIISHWHRLAEHRKTVVFATSVDHAVHIKNEFVKSGVRAAHIDGGTPKPERDGILERLSLGELELVTNCMVLTEGWDQPDVSCLVLARPTKSFGLYRQMVGRGLRPVRGKEFCLVLDHAGTTYQHGFVEEPVYWSLDVDHKARSVAHVNRQAHPDQRLTDCTSCGAVREAGKPCPVCGFQPVRGGRWVDAMDGELCQLHRNGKLEPHEYTPEQREEFQAMLVHIALERGYKLGWVAHKYRERFGNWPLCRSVEPIPPSAEVLAWDRHCRIKFAKRMAKEAHGTDEHVPHPHT